MPRTLLFGTAAGLLLVVLLVVALGDLADRTPRPPADAEARVRFSLEIPEPRTAPPAERVAAVSPVPVVAPDAVSAPALGSPAILAQAAPAIPRQTIARTVAQEAPPVATEPTTTQPAAGISRRRAQHARFGGTPGSENAVELGLSWLAAHQQPDGFWSRTRFPQQCPPDDRCPGVAVQRTGNSLHVGLTGLCTLSFLGAGYNDEVGPYRENVTRAIAALLRTQLPHGGFGGSEDMAGYNDALATFALAEAYAQNRNPALREPLERAVRRIVNGQQQLGGWDYLPRANAGRNDTSITAWMIQALQSADAAGISVPRTTLVRATLHLARATQSDGRVWYADAGRGFELTREMRPAYRYGPAMTAAGLLSRLLLGMRGDSPLAQQQTALLLADPPSEHALLRDETGLHSHYYWYYGTVALFQRGGPAWQRWNARLRDAVLPLQDRGVGDKRRHTYGSWAPFAAKWGKWGRMGGRVYTTALCVLTLETYYRHVPAYLAEDQPLRPADWLAVLPELSARERLWAVDVLAETRLEQGEPVLVQMLRDSEARVAVQAAIALSDLDSPLGADRLAEHAATITTRAHQDLQRAQRQIAALRDRPQAPGTLRVYDAARGLATIELPGCYVGQSARLERDGATIARLQVVQRFSRQPVSVARVIESSGPPPRAGDRVLPDPASRADGARP